MQLFLLTLSYFLLIGFCIFMICVINSAREKIKNHKKKVDEIENLSYKTLRELQFKSRNIAKLSNTYLKDKNSIFVEILSSTLIMFLPFKKLKSLLYLRKLYKKL